MAGLGEQVIVDVYHAADQPFEISLGEHFVGGMREENVERRPGNCAQGVEVARDEQDLPGDQLDVGHRDASARSLRVT